MFGAETNAARKVKARASVDLPVFGEQRGADTANVAVGVRPEIYGSVLSCGAKVIVGKRQANLPLGFHRPFGLDHGFVTAHE
jgi:hypothetical protein